MIPKRTRRPGRPPPAPLEVQVTLRFKFGETPEDVVTVMNDRRVPMVGSVFKSRDRIIKTFVTLLVRTGLAQARVQRELLPALRLMRARR